MHTKNRLALRLTLSLTALASGYTLLYQLSPVQAQMTGGYTSPSMMMPPMPAGDAGMGNPSMTAPGGMMMPPAGAMPTMPMQTAPSMMAPDGMMTPPMGAMPMAGDTWNAGMPALPSPGDYVDFSGAPLMPGETSGMEMTPEERQLFQELLDSIEEAEGVPYDTGAFPGQGMPSPSGMMTPPQTDPGVAAMEAKIQEMEAKIQALEAAQQQAQAQEAAVHEAAPAEACGFFCGIWQWITGLFA